LFISYIKSIKPYSLRIIRFLLGVFKMEIEATAIPSIQAPILKSKNKETTELQAFLKLFKNT
jgi:hypothetical protein